MATTDHFIGIAKRRMQAGDADAAGFTVGTSTTATTWLEFRWQEDTVADAAHPTGVTRKDIYVFLADLLKFFHEGGVDRAGTGCPAK